MYLASLEGNVKTLVTTLLSLFAVLMFVSPSGAAQSVRISQVYGGGGGISGQAAWDSDYIELFNASGTAVDLTGWALEYGSASGNYGSTPVDVFVFPEGASIAPCSYVLVAMTPGLSGFPLPVTPDYSGTLLMSATNGKVALFSAANPNTSCAGILPGTLVDKVSYGTANCAETSATTALTVAYVAVRNDDGLDDTDNNASDFTRIQYAEPRSSESAMNEACLATPSRGSTWGQIKGIYRH
jgi:hypothetical protein